MTDIVDGYLTELRTRMNKEMFGPKCDIFYLRRSIKVDEIHKMIDDAQARVGELVAKAQKIEDDVLAERRRKEILENLRVLNQQKLSFKPEDTQKRRSSFKGCVRHTLYKPGIQQEEADLALERGKP